MIACLYSVAVGVFVVCVVVVVVVVVVFKAYVIAYCDTAKYAYIHTYIRFNVFCKGA